MTQQAIMESLAMVAPSPLLLDSLLASSWTWLALCLATIATLLRALSASFRRTLALRPQQQEPLLQPASSASESDSAAFDSHNLRRRRRGRSKSTSSLEMLHHGSSDGGFLFSGSLSGFLYDPTAISAVRKVTSSSTICCGHQGQRYSPPEQAFRFGDDVPGLGLGLGLGLGSYVSDESLSKDDCCQFRELQTEDSLAGFLGDDEEDCSEDCTSDHFLPAWALHFCEFVHNSLQSLSSDDDYCDGDDDDDASLESEMCFERQFGWDKLLQSRLGSTWTCPVEPNSGLWGQPKPCAPTAVCGSTVKLWSPQEKKLLQTLKIDEMSATALDGFSKDGIACFGYGYGGVDAGLYDIRTRTCINSCLSSSASAKVSALTMNPEAMITIMGNQKSLSLWEHNKMSNCSVLPVHLSSPALALKSRDNLVCVAHDNGLFSMHDLRKPEGGNLFIDPMPPLPRPTSLFVAKPEDESLNFLWDKLSYDGDEDLVDEYFAYAIESEKQSSSFMSLCAGLFWSLSTKGN